MMKTAQSSTGGTIFFVSPGVIRHEPGEGAYSGRLAEEGAEAQTFEVAKKGRGRPRKNVGAGGAAYDFSAFPQPKVPKWKGPVRKIAMKA